MIKWKTKWMPRTHIVIKQLATLAEIFSKTHTTVDTVLANLPNQKRTKLLSRAHEHEITKHLVKIEIVKLSTHLLFSSTE